MYQPIILKYDLNDLEPNISSKTMDVHYNRHYLSYLRRLNNALNKNNKLQLMSLLGQDNPYNYEMIPIMNIDMWEHAYYLDHLNDKTIYINNFMELIDYNTINERYQKALIDNKQ